LLNNPKILILDEPFSGLDPAGRKDITDRILTARANGITIILCTHELWTVGKLCDDFHIFRQGKLVYTSHKPDSRHQALLDYFDLSDSSDDHSCLFSEVVE